MTDAETNHTVLIVDDEPIIRDVLQVALLQEGHEAFTAESLPEARDELDRRPVSLVITDVRLSPEHPQGGLDLLRYVRTHKPGTGVIVMSADLSSRILDKAASLGAMHCFQKPFSLVELMRCVGDAGREGVQLIRPEEA